jgi:hypothetical protein
MPGYGPPPLIRHLYEPADLGKMAKGAEPLAADDVNTN